MIKVYGAALSPFVRKVRVCLAEKGLEYEHIHVDPNRKPDNFSELSPLGRIPVLVDGEHQLADSGVVCQYLERQYPTPSLYPTAPYAYAQTLWFEKFADYELAPLCTFAIFRNRIVLPLIGKPCDEDKVTQARDSKLPPLLDYLESQLQPDTPVNGETLSVADIAITSQFINMQHGGECADNARWPTLCAWVNTVSQRPSYQQVLEQELAVVAKIRARNTQSATTS